MSAAAVKAVRLAEDTTNALLRQWPFRVESEQVGRITSDIHLELPTGSGHIFVVMSIEDLNRYAKLSTRVGLADGSLNRIADCDVWLRLNLGDVTLSKVVPARNGKIFFKNGGSPQHIDLTKEVAEAVELFVSLAGNYRLIHQALLSEGGEALVPRNEWRQRLVVACGIQLGLPFAEVKRAAESVYQRAPVIDRAISWLLQRRQPAATARQQTRETRWAKFIECAAKKQSR